jgi:hypothetical protein
MYRGRTTAFSFAGSFFTLQGEKRTCKNVKYHAAGSPEPVEGQARAAIA